MISKEKLIVRISGFGKNSVSKFWKNKKLNVLDMGYTLKSEFIEFMLCDFETFWNALNVSVFKGLRDFVKKDRCIVIYRKLV